MILNGGDGEDGISAHDEGITKGHQLKILRIKLIPVALITGLALSTLTLAPAHATATQADVDYSTQITELSQTFLKDATDHDTAHANPPTIAFGSKFNAYKARATKSSDKFLVTIKKMKALVAGPGFAKSGPLLITAMDLYEKGITALKPAVNKNDRNAITKANAVLGKAGVAFLAWSKAYTADAAALNG